MTELGWQTQTDLLTMESVRRQRRCLDGTSLRSTRQKKPQHAAASSSM